MPETWRSQRYQRNHSGVVRKFEVADLLDLLEQTRSQLVPNWPASFFHESLDLQPRSRTKRGNHSGIHCCLYIYTYTTHSSRFLKATISIMTASLQQLRPRTFTQGARLLPLVCRHELSHSTRQGLGVANQGRLVAP